MEETNMKKIIATVLAMVMAMALCVTAFAAVKYTAYDKTGKEIAKDVTYETCKAEFDKKAGDGMVAHYDVTMNGVTSYYVVAADAKTYDLKLTTSGKAPLYLVQVDSPYYVAKAVAFKAVGDGCGQLDVDTDETYYTSTKDDVVTYYVADKKGAVNVLVDNKLVAVTVLGDDLELVGAGLGFAGLPVTSGKLPSTTRITTPPSTPARTARPLPPCILPRMPLPLMARRTSPFWTTMTSSASTSPLRVPTLPPPPMVRALPRPSTPVSLCTLAWL